MIIDGKKIKNISQTRIYKIYYGMLDRCHNPKNHGYKSYGLKGIFVCDEWKEKKKGFIAFYKWSMKNGYKDDLTIDRIDNNKGYSPDNCRWATWEQQRNNLPDRSNMIIKMSQKRNIKEIVRLNNSCGFIFDKVMIIDSDARIGDKWEVVHCTSRKIVFKKLTKKQQKDEEK